jgi:Nucleotidyl transferase AbiEii toxin, Type IV TA system
VNIDNVLKNLIGFFSKEEIDFALIGAFALHAYGYVRATGDIDFVVRGKDQERIVRFLESLGYETLHRSKGFSNHLHPLSTLGRIDLIYVEGETAGTIFSETNSTPIFEGLSIPVVRSEHLIALKIFAMKNDPGRSFQEMADIQQLLKHTEIDIDEVRGYFQKYGQMEKFYELTGREQKNE